MKHVSSVSWFAVLLAVGCSTNLVDERSATQAIGTYVPQQGRLLLGFHGTDVRRFTLTGLEVDATGRLMLADGTLVKAGFKFTSTAGATSYRMRIRQVIKPAAPDTQWQYVLEQDAGGGNVINPCDDPTPIIPSQNPPDPEVRAYAFAGHWDSDGVYYKGGATDISFACKTAVVGKCIMWGFGADRAWPTSPPTTPFGTPFTAQDVLHACSRMARADYCGAGLPNTLDGTPIWIDDMFTFDPTRDPDGFFHEAGWPGRAVTRKGGPQPAVCLSKLRWATLPINGDCPLSLPDPRKDDKAKFCEDMTPQELDAKGALLYSSSTFIDAGLLTYRDANGRRLTTANLVPGKPGSLATWTPSSVPASGFPAGPELPVLEATIFAAHLAVALPAQPLVELSSYDCGGKLVTTTSRPEGCGLIALEGNLYPPGTPGHASLRRWMKDKQSWTTTRAPSTMLDEGYTLEENLGGVLRAGLDVNVRWSEQAGATYNYDVQDRQGRWITGCLGATPQAVRSARFTGECPGSHGHVNHADVIAFRVTGTLGGTPFTSDAVPYDGFASDVYVPFASTKPWAQAVQWKAQDKARYRLWFDEGGGYKLCADTAQLGRDTSYLHIKECYFEGSTVELANIRRVMVCSVDDNGKELGCGEADWDSLAPAIAVDIRQ